MCFTFENCTDVLLIRSAFVDVPFVQESSALDKAFGLQHWRDAGMWEDPCLRIGWIQGLKNMLQHPKALSYFVQSGNN